MPNGTYFIQWLHSSSCLYDTIIPSFRAIFTLGNRQQKVKRTYTNNGEVKEANHTVLTTNGGVHFKELGNYRTATGILTVGRQCIRQQSKQAAYHEIHTMMKVWYSTYTKKSNLCSCDKKESMLKFCTVSG